jgi:hypothetical protein
MGRFIALTSVLPVLFCTLLLHPSNAFAAGAVEMQVERIVTIAIDEYNQAMEDGNPASWLKYFTDNVRRGSPLGSQQGRAAFNEYYLSEFKSFKTHWNIKKTIVMGRSAVAIVECESARRTGDAEAKVDMAIVFELAPSGRFESLDFYFDPARLAKLAAAQ